MPFFIKDTDFGPQIAPAIAAALTTISPRQIERRLETARKEQALMGISTTKHGDLLKNQVPVRVYFSWDGLHGFSRIKKEIANRIARIRSIFQGN